MSYKTISLNSKAYELLKNEKKEGESYSETVIRLITQPIIQKYLELFGTLDIDTQELKEFKTEARKAWD